MADLTSKDTCGEGDDLLCAGVGAVGQELALAGFKAIWRGRAIRPDELVLGPPTAVQETAALLADRGRAELDDDGRLVGIHGLTLRPGRHWIEHDYESHFTWCAFDAVGIPAALGLEAVAHSDCPACRRSLRVDLRGARHAPTEGLVLWLPMMGATDDLRATFCAHADLYCSEDHLDDVVDRARTSGEVIGLEAAIALGGETWRDVAPAPSD